MVHFIGRWSAILVHIKNLVTLDRNSLKIQRLLTWRDLPPLTEDVELSLLDNMEDASSEKAESVSTSPAWTGPLFLDVRNFIMKLYST